ncbi:MAG: tetratricopeptide repeat protein [Desulfobacterales bacterium]|jgi:tetratricopeptide (TPR) repeat protein
MKKKYVIIAVISLVILVSFYGYRHFKKKDELKKHQEKTSSMTFQIAKNTPTGGMTEIGMALNRYAADNKAYPTSLQQLYPKYIYSKALLDEVDWDYKPKTDDFYLSKTVTYQNKRLATSIDKTLRSSFEKTIMISSAADVSKKVKEATKKDAPTKSLSKDVDWHKRAIALWKNTKYTDPKKALGYLNQAIFINQENAEAYNDRGIAKMNLGQHEQAINDYNQSIKLDPNYAKAYNNRGIAKTNLGQHEQAINDYNQSIKLDPNYAKAYNNRGIAKMNLGQYQQAINDYKQAVRLKPKFAGAFFNQGLANYELNKIDSMCNNFKKACELGNCEGSKWANKKGLCK